MNEHPAEHISAVQFLWYGHRNVPKPSDFAYSWKAVKTVAAADGELTVREQMRLLGKMCAILTPPAVVGEVMQFTPGAASVAELFAGIDVPPQVRPGTGAWLVYEALGVMVADGPLTAEELGAAREAAAAMEVPDGAVDTFAELWQAEEELRARRIRDLNSTIPTEFRFDNETEIQVLGRTRDLTDILAAARRAAARM
ncbi:MAG TPA: hypothetical protein VNT54_08050, partial [Solirubrobacteraceae bacterium]|nr:hypothetical protein [Solirubrobacteraceae bacterium]